MWQMSQKSYAMPEDMYIMPVKSPVHVDIEILDHMIHYCLH